MREGVSFTFGGVPSGMLLMLWWMAPHANILIEHSNSPQLWGRGGGIGEGDKVWRRTCFREALRKLKWKPGVDKVKIFTCQKKKWYNVAYMM